MATAKKGSKGKNGAGSESGSGSSESKPSSESQSPAKASESSKKVEAKTDTGASEVSIPGFSDNIRLGGEAQSLFTKAAAVAVVGLGGAIALGAAEGDGFKRFLHAYLVAYMLALAVSLGTLFWVTLQHLVNARWSTVVRRVGELFANNAPLMGVLSLPIVIPIMMGNPVVYEWADHAKVEADHLLHHKAAYLNPGFFLVRMVFYFGFWSLLARFFFRTSLAQDKGARGDHVSSMKRAAGPAMIVFALTLTFCAVDLLMSIDARWFSTIFGVYYFASCVLCANATLALSAMWLQSKGRLSKSITTEHFHDLGKMIFAFTVFWAYIGFSQFMLIWYANVPEETLWFKERFAHGWGNVSWVLLFGHFVIPFFGLLSRHVKRNRTGLAFWAIWQIVMVYIDMYWLVMPSIAHEGPPFGLVDLLCVAGMLGALVAGVALRARSVNLIPTKDPRLERSLSFQNI
jgi:hypothetical protein